MGMVELYMWNVYVLNIEWFDCIVFDFDFDLVLLWCMMIDVV